MSEETSNSQQERRVRDMHTISTMQGLPPGRNVHHIGLLDLRGVLPEQIAKVEEMHTVDVLLLEEETRSLLLPHTLHHVGSTIVAAPEERVLVTPQLDISRSGMESLPGGQRIIVMGNVFFQPDVPPALVAEKFESLRVFGVLIACAGVHGALLGKMQILNGVTLTLPDEIGTIVRAQGETQMSREYLSALPEGVTLINIGKMQLQEDLPAEGLRTKFVGYYNVGETSGPMSLVAILQARCPVNLGTFRRS